MGHRTRVKRIRWWPLKLSHAVPAHWAKGTSQDPDLQLVTDADLEAHKKLRDLLEHQPDNRSASRLKDVAN